MILLPRPKKEKPNRSDGLYEVKITIGKDINGKLKRKSFYSSISKDDARRQADKWKVEREVANRTNNAFVDKNVAFMDWAKKWLETYKKPNIDDNTYRLSYENTVNRHLVPYFGGMRLKDIKPIHVTDFYATKNTMSESMLSKMQMCLNGIFETAIDNDLCYKNPAKSVKFSTSKQKNVKKVYTDDQIKIVEEYAQERMPEVVILLETGFRRGELVGLKWGDIDLDNETISVNRSIADAYGGGTKINPPKWNSYRTNPLSKKAIEIINGINRTCDYVFPSETGSAQSPNTWSQKLERFMIGMRKVYPNVPMLTAHELRHTYGTKLRRDGVDIYTIQKVMGHRDIKMTSEIYVHNEIDSLKKAMKDSL